MTADSFWHRYTYYVTTPIPRKKKCTVPVSPVFNTDSCLESIADTNNDTLTASIVFYRVKKVNIILLPLPSGNVNAFEEFFQQQTE